LSRRTPLKEKARQNGGLSRYRNSASRMMIGIGTPMSQSNIPRPMSFLLFFA
jgi:hypothetical protein